MSAKPVNKITTFSRKEREKLSQQLINASKIGDIEEVKRLVNLGIDVNITLDYIDIGFKPLWYAISNKHTNVAKFLIERGADYEGDHSLLSAVQYLPELVYYLLARDANVNQCPPIRLTPILEAAKKGDLNIVKLLFAAGADIEIAEVMILYTPLHWACVMGKIDVVKYLINVGANVNANALERKSTPLDLTIRHHRTQIALLLLEAGAEVNIEGAKESILQNAIKEEALEIIELLLKFGAEITFEVNFDNSIIANLLKISLIADKIKINGSLTLEDIGFINANIENISLISTFVERAGKLLSDRCSSGFKVNLDTYIDTPYIKEIKKNYYQKISKLIAHKIISGKEVSPQEISIILEINEKPENKKAKNVFLEALKNEIKVNYKKFGKTLSAEKYFDIIGADGVDSIIKATREIKDDYLTSALDIIADMFDCIHIPNLSILAEEKSTHEAILEELREYNLARYPAKAKDINALFNIAVTSMEDPIELLINLLRGIVLLNDEILDIREFLIVEPEKSFNERQADVYRIIRDLMEKNMLPRDEAQDIVAIYCEHMYKFETTPDSAEIIPAAGGAGDALLGVASD